MSFYHVRITTKAPESTIEVELDVEAEELEQLFLEPYRLGRPIVISGRTIAVSELARIQISETPYGLTLVNKQLGASEERRNIITHVYARERFDPLKLSQRGVNVTKKYIKGPPGHAASTQSAPTKETRPATNAREVFVVHGRNTAAREAMFEFLRALGLHPLEWAEAVSDTRKASPYIGEVLDAAFARAHAIVVLFTPDDEARIKEQFRADNDPPHETQLTGQARPNVLFEAGMAMARSQNRTILVELGNLRPYSDIGGRHTIRLDNSPQRRQELAQRLQTAGCPARLTGTDWHAAGDFQTVLDELAQWSSAPTDGEEQGLGASVHALTQDARKLLVEAARDEAGIISMTRTFGGVVIQTNGSEFGHPDSRRSIARWEQAIQDLLDEGLLNPLGDSGEVFEVTHKGYRIADELGDT